ncbi:aspartate kinase [Desulfonispora thiosulfatigenes DSM 11270]|uniref:Aspartokinase n=1 Tax=Desulfonispora thiosulfatigenes DSM 11270 TaxID=656914 RepID=A0A1W1VMN6_DESTI|nr:aspartate kinase [Desulfonispora thiosulfatigenes]SMB94490.1 aspartate kinase [Desulfonispora thiosulfatigenes DSM 11270]
MALIVQKFGGSSVADVSKIQNIAQKISKFYSDNNKIVVVVSAMGDSTDILLEMANEINSHPSSREMDMLLSTGEQVSIALLAMALDAINIPVISFTGSQVGIITDNIHCKARINKIVTDKITCALDENKVVIVAGFQGRTIENEITTLGRGGSDTTAVALATSLNADLCEIYTDVDGVYTTDPRIVKEAVKLNEITYDEMLELASLGAGVLHPRSVELAKLYNVPLSVRSSFSNEEGTKVVNTTLLEKEIVVTGVTRDLNVAKIGLFDVPDIPGIASKIFNFLANEHINVDMIVQSAMRNDLNDIAFTIPKDDLNKALEIINRIKDDIKISEVVYADDVAKVSIVGAGMITSPGVAAKMFKILADNNVNLKMISTSEIKVSCIVDADQADKSVQLLHESFNLANLK